MPEVEGSWCLHSIGLPLPYLANLRCISTIFTFLAALALHILILAYPAQFSLNICLMHLQRRRLLHQLLVELGRFGSRGQVQVTMQIPSAGVVGLFDICRTPRCCIAMHEQAIGIFAVAINSEELAIARDSKFPGSRLAVACA